MIDKRYAGQEIARLIGLDYFPSDEKAVKELVTALTFAETEIIATAVINEWLEDQKQRPTPADLRRLVANHNEAHRDRLRQDSEGRPASFGCGKCQDSGIVGGYIGTKHDGPWEWCGCMATWRKQKDDPGFIEECNRVRDKLLARFGAKPLPGMLEKFAKQRKHLSDEYFGDF